MGIVGRPYNSIKALPCYTVITKLPIFVRKKEEITTTRNVTTV